MRIVVWNCNRGLARKQHVLDEIDADIAVIPECAQAALPEGRSIWKGSTPNKGLGVISRTLEPRVAACYDESLRWFIPVEFANSPIKLLAAWAFNHRDRLQGRSSLGAAVDLYAPFLALGNAIVAGDMNDNRIWDTKPRLPFADAIAHLDQLGYGSAYHHRYAEPYGSETRATFRHSSGGTYHIDYCFLPKAWLVGVDVDVRPIDGDHAPLVITFHLSAA